jgi:hypothetical protein
MADEEANALAAKKSTLGLDDTQFPLFITMVAGIILIVATGNANDWSISVRVYLLFLNTMSYFFYLCMNV